MYDFYELDILIYEYVYIYVCDFIDCTQLCICFTLRIRRVIRTELCRFTAGLFVAFCWYHWFTAAFQLGILATGIIMTIFVALIFRLPFGNGIDIREWLPTLAVSTHSRPPSIDIDRFRWKTSTLPRQHRFTLSIALRSIRTHLAICPKTLLRFMLHFCSLCTRLYL